MKKDAQTPQEEEQGLVLETDQKENVGELKKDLAKNSTKEKKNSSDEKFNLSMEAMLKAGLHFGHKKARWNPKTKNYIFGVRNGIQIIDLEKTLQLFQKALDFIEEIVKKDGQILVVGTKKQAKQLVRDVAEKGGMPYVNERWLGGTFTNFKVISKRINYLIDTEEALEKGKLAGMTKLEKNKLEKKLEKIEQKMGGLKTMKGLPSAVFVLDVIKDRVVVKEAQKAKIKVIGLVDTNSDPDGIDYPIPANDDALSSLRYVLGVFLKKILETKNLAKKEKAFSETKK